jgi:hypothetical protein
MMSGTSSPFGQTINKNLDNGGSKSPFTYT